MQIYNTASRTKEPFKVPADKKVKYYSCGPTVYEKPTIGNWASFIRYDILARTLRSEGYEVDWVMNITDVGHLVSDADEGEDKLEKTARKEAKTAWQIAEHYSGYFIGGLDYFNISIPKEKIVRATDYIDKQIDVIKKLETAGHTYITADGVYFDSTTVKDYGKMAKLDIKGQKTGARISMGGKRHPTDFALWKFSPKDKKRDMEWDSPWGRGFPGWHLECSAIILSELGQTIDIHAGGIEHIPIHHTNEIAQSESVTNQPLSRYWVHNNHLKINGQKISKSLDNGYTIEDLKNKGFNGKDFRMFVLNSNYRNEANFTWLALEEARRKRLELQAAADLRFQLGNDAHTETTKGLTRLRGEIEQALADNLNTSLGVSYLARYVQEFGKEISQNKDEFIKFLKWLDDLFGFELLTSVDITAEQKRLITERINAREQGDWQVADNLRSRLKHQNIGLDDVGRSSLWFRMTD
ncbi:MAG TPA: cysteine--tRNA ligase [Candidatus Saccharimonadales bacterium]|nr:cysteine--tRNA ligase [Candidatus Saccharimonadales bacterium]